MSWMNAVRKIKEAAKLSFIRPEITPSVVDWARLVTLDFETYYDQDYTLSKLSTSEYVRDPRFKAQMVGIKIGLKPTKWYPAAKVAAAVKAINWATHSLLCHNTQFDGFILSHHYGIVPVMYYDTLSMARGLHSNEIGASLDEVAQFYGKGSKIEGALEATKGVLVWSKAMNDATGVYCAQDVDLTFEIFKEMHAKFPADEIDLISMTCGMFCDPVLKVDIPRVEKELARELDERKRLFYAAVNPKDWEKDPVVLKEILKTRAERELVGEEREMLIIKRVIGSNERFSKILTAEGITPPVKIAKAWMKLSKEEKVERLDDKYSYAFAKDDTEFISLPENIDVWRGNLNPNKKADIAKIAAKQDRIRGLVECRLSVKSTTNITRAQRFLTAGANGMSLPCGYAYYRAHTGRMGGNNKMNMQNLTRGGELRLSILAPKGHMLAVADSGQIEARVNAWLWGQDDLLDAFRSADTWDKSKGVAKGKDRDAYCRFGDIVYGREITTNDKMERFVGKVCIAEGEPVLTRRGLVPINLISKEDWLWDGVEWVTHDGVIDQGIREVITYDGLTATPDHEVFTEDGRIIPLGQAASEMARLQNTGAEGQSIRFCDDHVVADTPRKRLSVRVGAVQPEWSQETDLSQQPEERENNLVPQERAQASSPRKDIGQPVRRDSRPVQQPSIQTLDELRRAGNQMSVQDSDGVHPVGIYESTARELQGRGDRQDREQRALRAGQLEVGDQDPAEPEQTQHTHDLLARTNSADPRVCQPMESDIHIQAVERRDDWRTNAREVRTFDIVNAGPRRRYTVSGKLCLNCVLGLGFQMGAPKFQMTLAKGALGGPPVYFELDHCQRIVAAYRHMNHRIEAGWGICKRIIEDMAAGRTGTHGPISWEKGTIWLPNGMSLKYPDLKKTTDEKGWDAWSYQSGDIRKKIYGGLLCLGGGTQVLTDNGWKSIVSVRLDDKLWDGTNWVSHSGLVHRGVKETISFGGVDMTPDHEVLVDSQWVAAEKTTHHEATSSFTRHYWAPNRHTDSSWSGWQRRSEDPMDSSVSVRAYPGALSLGVHKGQHEELRMLDGSLYIRVKNDTRHVETPGLRGVAGHARPLQPTKPSGLGALRRAWDYGVSAVGEVRGVLGRYASWLQTRFGAGPTRQLAGVQPGQLPLGNKQGQLPQQTLGAAYPDAGRHDAVMAGRRSVRDRKDDAALPPRTPMACSEDVRQTGRQQQDVFDLVDAGPLKRFTVRGDDGQPFIVHNCENIVQALARIIVMWQMLQVGKKYRVVMTTHDEVVACPRAAQADACYKFMYKWMTTAPDWCKDIPLAAEGGWAENYSK